MINWILDLFYNRTFGATRSLKWNEVRDSWVKQNPVCVVCSSNGTLLNRIEVHHIKPFHLHPELELDTTNFITLCRQHHYLFGHFNNWNRFNSDVILDAQSWKARIAKAKVL